MNIVSGAKQFGGCDQEIVGTLQPTVQEVVGAPWPVRSWDCLMLRWERFVTDPRPCGIGRRRPCEAHGRTKAYAARALPDSLETKRTGLPSSLSVEPIVELDVNACYDGWELLRSLCLSPPPLCSEWLLRSL